MWRSRTVRELVRQHADELRRRDEMIQQLLDRIQHPARTPVWREPVAAAEPTENPYFPAGYQYDPNSDGET